MEFSPFVGESTQSSTGPAYHEFVSSRPFSAFPSTQDGGVTSPALSLSRPSGGRSPVYLLQPPWARHALEWQWIDGATDPLRWHPELRWEGQRWGDWLGARLEQALWQWEHCARAAEVEPIHASAGAGIPAAAAQVVARAKDAAGAAGVLQLATNTFITLDVLALALLATRSAPRRMVLARSLAGLAEVGPQDSFATSLPGFRPRPDYAAFCRRRGRLEDHQLANIFRLRKTDVLPTLHRALQELREQLAVGED